MDWQQDFIGKGYALFPKLVPQPLIDAARAAITSNLRAHYDPARFEEYDSISYCPGITASKPIMNLLRISPVWDLLDGVFGADAIMHDHGQIAIRQAHNSKDKYVQEYHLDGVPNGKNGLTGQTIQSFTALVGVFLNDIPETFSGNLAVWPGSHLAMEKYFRDNGLKAMDMGRPEVEIGEPVQITAMTGDVVLCHYELAHSVASNVSDRDRVAVYFRVSLKDIVPRRWEMMTNIWRGWKIAPAP